MRVAIITENFLPKLDGVTRTLARLLEYLQAQGHQALLLGPESGMEEYAGAEIVGTAGLPLPFYPEVNVPPVRDWRLLRSRPRWPRLDQKGVFVPSPESASLKFNFFRPLSIRRLNEFQPHIVHLVDPVVLGTAGLAEARQRSWSAAMQRLFDGYQEVIVGAQPLAAA